MKEIIKEIVKVSDYLSHAICMGYGTEVKSYQNQLIALVKALEVIAK